jgi:hypothetical protein
MRLTYDKPDLKKSKGRLDIRLPRLFSNAEFLADLDWAVTNASYDYRREYLKQHMLSKYVAPGGVGSKARADAAIAKWLATERRNARTNMRLQLAEDVNFGWTDFPDLVRRVRSLISRILGPMPYPQILREMQHTTGASTRVPRSSSAALFKLVGDTHCSDSALKHWFAVASGSRLSSQVLTPQNCSKLFTVPKSSIIDRVACKEPETNMLMQRSCGRYIRERLKLKVGINLRDQTVNQNLARVAFDQGLATIDLSSASDSMTRQAVFELLPFDWWSLLDDLRVGTTLLPDGTLHEMEMFSTMGNGFTFELESLIFYALTRVCCEISKVRGSISVYGDDIIAPAGIYRRLKDVLGFFGFITNVDKTFADGPLRESCGRHYYRGFDVSPFFVRRPVTTLPDLINLLNQVMKWSSSTVGFIEDPDVLRFWQRYRSFVPPYLWGGVSPEENTALVTGHAPRYRLVSENEKGSRPPNAALTFWFMGKEFLEEEFEVDPQFPTRTKVRRVSTGWRTHYLPEIADCDNGNQTSFNFTRFRNNPEPNTRT